MSHVPVFCCLPCMLSHLCFQWHKHGDCRRGDACPWVHDETPADRARAERVRSKGKGKGKGKRTGKSDASAALAMDGWEEAM